MKGLFFHLGQYITWHKAIYQKTGNFSMFYKEVVRQVYDIGVGSLLIVFIISIFIGAVTAQQMYYQLSGTSIPSYYIGYIVRDMAIIELAVTFTSLVLAGKVGSNLAAEIGGMRQKEHIDAMEIMGVNTASYLVLPKIIGGLIAIPILVFIAAIVNIGGGYLASVPTGLFTNFDYVKGLRSFFNEYNVLMMFVKSVVFAYIIITVSCYQGYFVKGGNVELGQASTRAVVFSCVLVLVFDYIIAVILTSG